MSERTLVLIKPDGVQRALVGEVIKRLETKGLQLVGMKMMQVSEELASEHYAEHRDKDFYPDLVNFITSAPIIAMVWQGKDAISQVRALMGATDPAKAAPGTMRGDFCLFVSNNLVHGSDSSESAAREVDLFFQPFEIFAYEQATSGWIGY